MNSVRFTRFGFIRKLLVILAGLTIALSVMLVALLNWPLPEMPRPGVTGEFLVSNVAIVDAVNGRIVPEREVVVRNGRIDSIGASRLGSGQRGLVVVDGTGKFLIPGRGPGGQSPHQPAAPVGCAAQPDNMGAGCRLASKPSVLAVKLVRTLCVID